MSTGWAVWLTGLPGCGKSTVAKLLARRMLDRGVKVQILSSDMLRKVLTPKPKYDEEERALVYGALVFITQLLTESGVNVLIDATGNRRRYRNKARKEITKFMEAYVKCPLNICVLREAHRKRRLGAPRQIYKKAFKGTSSTVPGFGTPYEEPLHPEVVVETDKLTPKQAVDRILKVIDNKFLLRTP